MGMTCWVFIAMQVFSSSCSKQGLLSGCGAGASGFGGSSVAQRRLWGMRASVGVAHGLSSCGSWALEHIQ